MNEVLLVGGVALVTFLIHYPVLVTKVPLPDRVFRALRYVPPAVLDLKPYVPAFDRGDAATIPDWMNTLMQGYF